MSTITVLYEDNHIIAVVKPAGVLSQPDNSGDTSMIEEVKKYLKEKYKKPGKVFLGLVHRLDRPVQGIMLFAKTSKGASRLSEQFRNQQIEKTYQAIVVGRPQKDRGVLINKIQKSKFKSQNDNAKFKSIQKESGVEVVLHYEILQSNGRYSLLKITIESGKFHQIRAQLSIAGFPILGDVKYLPASQQAVNKWNNKNAIALCATDISFKQATGDEIIRLSIEIPEEWINYI